MVNSNQESLWLLPISLILWGVFVILSPSGRVMAMIYAGDYKYAVGIFLILTGTRLLIHSYRRRNLFFNSTRNPLKKYIVPIFVFIIGMTFFFNTSAQWLHGMDNYFASAIIVISVIFALVIRNYSND